MAAPRIAWSMTGDLDSTNAHFHRAEVLLVTGHYANAMLEYADVLGAARTLDIDLREWFCGDAYYGLAFCAAALGDTMGTRHYLDEAMANHYWMFQTVHNNGYIVNVAGSSFVDSLCDFWLREQREKHSRWRAWEPVVITPRTADASQHLATIIALHGGFGNVREFATHWQDVADSLRAVVIVPPGTGRPSPVGFTWDGTMDEIDSSLQRMMNNPAFLPYFKSARMYIAGFSQGGRVAVNLTMRHTNVFRGAIVIEGFNFDRPDSGMIDGMQVQGTRVAAVYGELGYQPFLNDFKSLQACLASAHIPVRLTMQANMVHEVPANLVELMCDATKWIDAGRAVHAATRAAAETSHHVRAHRATGSGAHPH